MRDKFFMFLGDAVAAIVPVIASLVAVAIIVRSFRVWSGEVYVWESGVGILVAALLLCSSGMQFLDIYERNRLTKKRNEHF